MRGRRSDELRDLESRTGELLEQLARVEQKLDGLLGESAGLRETVDRLASEQSVATTARVQAMRRTREYAAAYEDQPLVSARIGVYQPDEVLFDRALASLRKQSYPHWEAILVSDGVDTITARRIASLNDDRIKLVQRPRRGHVPADPAAGWQVAGVHTFNESISHARGAWIAPLDQDDEWTPDHLEVLTGAAQRSWAELVYGVCAVQVSDAGMTYFGSWPPSRGDFGFQASIYHAGLARFMLYEYNAHHSKEPADWHLARRMLEAGVRFEFVSEVLATYYIDRDALSFDWWCDRVDERGPYRGSVT